MSEQFTFSGGCFGAWRILSSEAVRGAGLPAAERLNMTKKGRAREDAQWTLRGVISNVRYATRAEVSDLRARQQGLGRPAARRAALIPIKKSDAWWSLAQDERRAIFEETSHHTQIGVDYLPQIARQLFHSRDLGEDFDFLTWFEYSADDAAAFETLVIRLRSTPEWSYVEREIDIRLARD